MTPPFVHRETVRWQDIDCHGVLNNAVYLTLFEQARYAYFRTLGQMRGDRFPFLVGEASVRFEKSATAGLELAITARVTRLGDSSFDMEYVVEHARERLATGRATMVWVDESARSQRIPDLVREAIRAREGWAADRDAAAIGE